MSGSASPNPFDDLRFADFQRMARDPHLSAHEKIGFPDAYREGFEAAIYADIRAKLPALGDSGRRVLDIGPGCAGLPRMLISDCRTHGHELVLVDSEEMLAHLPDGPGLTKIAGRFPECHEALAPWAGAFDAILCYSVFHYVFVEAGFWDFLDRSLRLLAPGGRMLIGDIPNVSKRKRFFASEAGIAFHKRFMKTDEPPAVDFRAVETGRIDDAVILGVLMRARAEGCDAYWLPQPDTLPMANRREDIVICKP
jgi:SAM-dependent methyltransferase